MPESYARIFAYSRQWANHPPCFYTSEDEAGGGRFAGCCGSILLIPKVAVDLVLAEKYQLAGIDWAAKEKGKKK
jgi:hypothetical protein